MNPTNFDASEVTRCISATTIGRLKSAIKQGKVLVGAWQLSDRDVAQRREIDAGCGCGCGPAD